MKEDTEGAGVSEEKAREIQDWETSTYAGLMFGLRKYRDRLEEVRGFKLNSKPREIDVRIIDKKAGTQRIENAIGYLFERHNIIELKNPNEDLNLDVVWKGISYAAQYKSRIYDDTTGEHGVDAIPIDDVTLTFLRVSRPRKLFKGMEKRGYLIEEKFPGVFYITGMVDIKMQVVVGSMLKGDEFAPIRIQKSNVSEDDVRKAVGFFETLVDRADVDMANTIMRISIMGNRDLYARLREVDEMYDAFADLMKDYVEAKVATEVEAKVAAEREGLATRMLQGNYSVVEISRLTDVSEERLAELAEEIGKEPTVRHS